MCFVYLLYSKNLDLRYVGSTNNLNRRFNEHINGHCKFTKVTSDWKLIYYKAFLEESIARLFEQLVKRNKKYRKAFYLEAQGVDPMC